MIRSPAPARDDQKPALDRLRQVCAQGLLFGFIAFPQLAGAVSGGGLDYANIDITGQDFSSQKLKGKDFTQV